MSSSNIKKNNSTISELKSKLSSLKNEIKVISGSVEKLSHYNPNKVTNDEIKSKYYQNMMNYVKLYVISDNDKKLRKCKYHHYIASDALLKNYIPTKVKKPKTWKRIDSEENILFNDLVK